MMDQTNGISASPPMSVSPSPEAGIPTPPEYPLEAQAYHQQQQQMQQYYMFMAYQQQLQWQQWQIQQQHYGMPEDAYQPMISSLPLHLPVAPSFYTSRPALDDVNARPVEPPRARTHSDSESAGEKPLRVAPPLTNAAAPGGSTAASSSRPPRRRQKSLSSSAATSRGGLQGSFWDGPTAASTTTAPLPPPPPPPGPPPLPPSVRPSPPPSPRSNAKDGSFSPRNDFLAMVGDKSSPRNGQRKSPRQSLRTTSPVGQQQARVTLAAPPFVVPSSPHTAAVERTWLLGGPSGPTLVPSYSDDHDEEVGKTIAPPPPPPPPRPGLQASSSHRRRQGRQQSVQNLMTHVKGVEQPPACRNVLFLVLFVAHLVLVAYLGQRYGANALAQNHNESSTTLVIYYDNLVKVASLSGAFAILLSGLLMFLMMTFSHHFVQVMLLLTITLSFIWGTLGVGLSPRKEVPISGIILLALSVGYTFIVWDRIPFASVNLETALAGIRAHPGTIVVSFIFQALALGWSVYFCVVAVGIYDAFQNGQLFGSRQWHVMVYILLGYSYYWTIQVLLHAVQASTARVIGGWWHWPEDGPPRPLVRQATFRVTFYSLGSICLGSLVLGPVRLLRMVTVLFRPNPDQDSLMCLYECVHVIQVFVASGVDSLVARVNVWAFSYIVRISLL
jgi:Plasma-membrane choline transporter